MGSSADLSSEQQVRFEQLLALGYVQGALPASPLAGVTVHRADRVLPGVNLVVSAHAPEAVLLDMQGRELHRWQRAYADIWPDRTPPRGVFHRYWRRVHLLPGGALLAIVEQSGLVKLDRDSRVQWIYDAKAHHDLFVGADGRIYVLTRAPRTIQTGAGAREIAEDFITILDSQGRLERRVSLYDAVAASDYAGWLRGARRSGDIFHTNTIEVLDGRFADRLEHFRAGNVMVSIWGVHAIAIVDLEAESVVWGVRGGWRAQHQPTLLDNGRILLFDNLGLRDRSRLLEIQPIDGRIRWVYETPEPGGFFSPCCGSNQRLANGNTLITETEKGRAFEIDRRGAIVWEYWNPHRVSGADDEEKIALLFDVVRLPAELPLDWVSSGR